MVVKLCILNYKCREQKEAGDKGIRSHTATDIVELIDVRGMFYTKLDLCSRCLLHDVHKFGIGMMRSSSVSTAIRFKIPYNAY